MKRKSFVQRFIVPLILVVGIRQFSNLVYHSASALTPGLFREVVIGTSGPLTFISLWFFAFIGPPLAYFRGAHFIERLIIAVANPVIWILMIDREIACQFSGIERIYFFFLPWTFGIMCVTCVEFSIAELICRGISKYKFNDRVKLLSPIVLLMLVGGLVGTYFGLINGQRLHHPTKSPTLFSFSPTTTAGMPWGSWGTHLWKHPTWTDWPGKASYLKTPLSPPPCAARAVPAFSRASTLPPTVCATTLAVGIRKKTSPFCLYLSHKAVHHDWKPPAHLKGRYKDADLSHLAPESDKYNTWTGLNWLEGTMSNMHSVYKRYHECLASVDEQVGRLVDVLDQKNLLENTVIIYAGDNGYMWGEHRLYAKHYPYEESIRIPYIVRAPDYFVSDPGRRVRQMVLNIDLAPTLLEMAGLKVPEAMQGESFLDMSKNWRPNWTVLRPNWA